MARELWSTFKAGERTYEISSVGRIKGKVVAFRKPSFDRDGYQIFTYQDWLGGGKVHTHTLKVHRLIFETFVGPILPNMVINHKNGKKSDNRVENLEAATVAGNIQHSFEALGRIGVQTNPSKGEKNGNSKFKTQDILDMRSSTLSVSKLARKYKTAESVVRRILQRKTWKHI